VAPGLPVAWAALAGILAGAGQAHVGSRVDYVCDGYREITVVFDGDAADPWLGSARIGMTRPPGELGYASADGLQQISGGGADLLWIDAAGRNWWCVERPDASDPVAPAGLTGLEGTSWRLLHFRAPAAQGGVQVPSHPEEYRITFGAQGRLTMRLNCNRLRGSWIAVPLSAHHGTVEFSGGLMIRADCTRGAPDALEIRIANALSLVRAYAIHDGTLILTLEGSGGSCVRSPLP
jgi:hypothetical protein